MKDFNPTRFLHLLICDVREHRRQWLKLTAGMFLGCLLLEYAIYQTFFTIDSPRFRMEQRVLDYYPHEAARLFLFFYFFVLLFGASGIFSCLRSKGERISYLMLPATNTEKYASRMLQAILGYSLAFFVAFVTADLVRMAVLPLFGFWSGSAVPHFFRYIGSGLSYLVPGTETAYFSNDPLTVRLFPVLCLLACHAFYTAGSALFRRQPFILTSLILVFVMVVGTTIFAEAHSRGEFLSEHRFFTHFIVLEVLLAVATVFFHWFSYQRFKRARLIGRKLWDV